MFGLSANEESTRHMEKEGKSLGMNHVGQDGGCDHMVQARAQDEHARHQQELVKDG